MLHPPRMALIRQRWQAPVVDDVRASVCAEFARIGLREVITPGMSVAITAGSRGIANFPVILAAVVEEVKKAGGCPFIVPAMGSHGGATADGQVAVLAELGITEASVGAPIRSSMDVVQVAKTVSGIPVYVDRLAAEAGGIIVVNRVKSHTEFQGEIESGLMKMMVIGLGKHLGATTAHQHGALRGFSRVLLEIARAVLASVPVIGGLAVVENACHQTAEIVALRPAEIEESERRLLRKANELMARLPFEDIDILFVDEMGKEISGAGMDTKVIGRLMVPREPELDKPRIKRIIVRDLTKASQGSAGGIGLADFTTRRLVNKIDYHATNVNLITSDRPEKARIPIVAENDRQALHYALMTIGAISPSEARIVRIKNTLELEVMLVSEALLPETLTKANVEILSEPMELVFDEAGDLVAPRLYAPGLSVCHQ
ncbi:MAG: DUF362 domain-containing protein [Chloroflexota bacterium]